MKSAATAKNPVADSWEKLARQAADRFAQDGFPTKKEESWRYTSMRKVSDAQLKAAPPYAGDVAVRQYWGRSQPLVLVDGRVVSQPSAITGLSFELVDLENLTKEQEASLLAHIDTETSFEQAGHIALNRAEAKQAIVVTVSHNLSHGERSQSPSEAQDDVGEGQDSGSANPHPKSEISTSPSGRGDGIELELHHIAQAAEAGSFTPIILKVETGAKLTFVERFYGNAATQHLQNIVANIVLEEGASLTHFRSQTLPEGVTHLYSAQLAAHENSRYESFTLMAGASISRQEVQMHLLGEGAHADIQGIVLGNAKQHFDSYLPVYHDAPGCYSNQHIRQLLDGASSGVYYGRAEVPTTSPRTEAHQLNKNLLLCDEAEVYTRPELDILTDEVVCSHGATTGSLDEDALYYLQARGIPFEQARTLLTQGFVEELLEAVKPDAIRDGLRAQVQDAMGAAE